MIFPKYYTDQLSEIFLKKENGKQSPPATSTMTTTTTSDSMDGEPVNDNEDVDGEPVDLDGEPLEEEDLDGEPLEEEDGEPIMESIEQRRETENLYTPVNDMFSLK